MLVWIAVLAVIGASLLAAGVPPLVDPVAQNLVGLSAVMPIVIGAAVFESSRRAATPGKRALRLTVEHASGAPSFGRALARNALKIGLPWGIGHVAVYAIVDAASTGAAPEAWTSWLLAGSYAIPLVWLGSLFARDGRTVYDRITATKVRRRTTAGDEHPR